MLLKNTNSHAGIGGLLLSPELQHLWGEASPVSELVKRLRENGQSFRDLKLRTTSEFILWNPSWVTTAQIELFNTLASNKSNNSPVLPFWHQAWRSANYNCQGLLSECMGKRQETKLFQPFLLNEHQFKQFKHGEKELKHGLQILCLNHEVEPSNYVFCFLITL